MSAVRFARKRNQSTDRISNLPQSVAQQILERLPLQEAGRTSILSSHWKQIWASISQLILDKRFFNSILMRSLETADLSLAYSNAVNNILLSHAGPIYKFVLYLPSWFPKESDISQWIRHVRSKGVKELTLEYDWGLRKNLSKLPSCLFSCEGLTHLTLIHCNFLPLPPTFRGFPCLVSLKLDMGSYYKEANVLENLISKCPQLQSLSLSLSIQESGSYLTIRAPNLQDLYVKGGLPNLSLEGTTNIKKLALYLATNFEHDRHLIDFFSNLLRVEMLTVGGLFWTMCRIRKFRSPQKFPRDLERLQTLKLVKVSLFCHSSILLVICLCTSSPHLQQLFIEASVCEERKVPDGQPIQNDGSCILPCLKNVQLLGISGLSNELQLMKFLLACSPALEEMTIELSLSIGGAAEKLNFATESIRYRRASPYAEIIIKTEKKRL